MSLSNLSAHSVLSIIAPTASGKTALAYELFDTGKFELVSVDSALIYKDMNIGTAKPTVEELVTYPHHLVDIITPEETYNVAEFCRDVTTLIDEIHNRNKIPILVGGTMMYYMAMFDGISNIPSTSVTIRKKVATWLDAEGIEALYAYLIKYDPLAASRLNMTDTQRITRAVEIFEQTNKPLSEWQKLPKNALAHNKSQHWVSCNIIPDRQWLHQRIEQRLEQMWLQGFVKEVIYLLANYQLTVSLASVRCIGYRQVIDFLLAEKLVIIENDTLKLSDFLNNIFLNKDATDLDKIVNNTCQDMKNKALYASRQLAKRQCTWLNKINNLSSANQVTMHSFSNIEEIRNKLL